MSQTTYADAIRIARQTLCDAGVERAQTEARRLVALASSMTPTALISAEPNGMEANHLAAWESLLRQRASRKPFAHLAGQAEFYGLMLTADARALIPRADSECVIDLALSRLDAEKPTRIADLGTGSGCLLLALLSQRPLAAGEGIDASDEALTLARENAAMTGLSSRAAFAHASWSDWRGWADVDLIISNPPYIATDVIATLEPEVRDHDPHAALDGGPDGLDAYREIITLAATRMAAGSWLVLEIGYDQKKAVTELLELANFSGIEHKKDLSGHERAIMARKR